MHRRVWKQVYSSEPCTHISHRQMDGYSPCTPSNLLIPEFIGTRPLTPKMQPLCLCKRQAFPTGVQAQMPRPATQQACLHTSPPWAWEALPGTRTLIPSDPLPNLRPGCNCSQPGIVQSAPRERTALIPQRFARPPAPPPPCPARGHQKAALGAGTCSPAAAAFYLAR